METQIRIYRKSDFKNVLQLMNASCEYDEFSEDLLKEKIYEDPSWGSGSMFVAERAGRIVGFMLGVVRDIRGETFAFVKLMAVDKDCRREGIAGAMLVKFEAFAKKAGAKGMRIYDATLNYYMPGVDPRYTEAVLFAEKHGFKRNGESLNMKVDLENRDWDTVADIEALAKEGIAISRAKAAELGEILYFLSKEWALWEYEVTMAMKSDPPSVFIARKDDEVKGFAAYDGNNRGTGWFGPMGTDLVFRGKGIGRILLYMCLEDMKKHGYAYSTIPWVAPLGFYANHAGAKVDRTFWRYQKNIE